MKLIYYGNGAFGQAIAEAGRKALGGMELRALGRLTGNTVPTPITWEPKSEVPENTKEGYSDTIFVYAGKGTNIGTALGFCHNFDIPMIQASTEKELIPKSDEEVIVPTLYAPNANPLIVAALKGMADFSATLRSFKITAQVMESHQASKASVSGTARAIADTFEVPHEKISMLRTPAWQSTLGIRNLDRHGFHMVKINGMEAEVGFYTKAEGLAPYAEGLIWYFVPRFCRERLAGTLKKRVYSVTEFI